MDSDTMNNYFKGNEKGGTLIINTPPAVAQNVPVIEVISNRLEKQFAELAEIVSVLEGRHART